MGPGLRGFRFRLAVSYVSLFTLLIAFLGIVFRHKLSTTFTSQTQSILEEQWGAAKGYLRASSAGPDWVFDKGDPDESFIVNRIRSVYLLADTQGRPLEHSEIYGSIGLDSPDEIKKILHSGQPVTRVRKDHRGTPYMIRSGLMIDERHQQYYLAIGRAVDSNDRAIRHFTWGYFGFLPVAIAVVGLLAWFFAGRSELKTP